MENNISNLNAEPNLSEQSYLSDSMRNLGTFAKENKGGSSPFNGLGPFGFMCFLVKTSFKGLLSVFSLRFFISILFMTGVWLGLALAKIKWPNALWVYVGSILTFAQAGLYGGMLGSIGGILGKTFLGSYFIRMMAGSASNKVVREFGKGNNWVSSFSSWLFGVGLGLILYNFTNVGMLKENSIIGLFAFFICLKMQKDPDNLTIGFINSFVNGKPKNPRAAKYLIAGVAWGALIGFILVWTLTGQPYIAYIAGGTTSLIGGVLFLL